MICFLFFIDKRPRVEKQSDKHERKSKSDERKSDKRSKKKVILAEEDDENEDDFDEQDDNLYNEENENTHRKRGKKPTDNKHEKISKLVNEPLLTDETNRKEKPKPAELPPLLNNKKNLDMEEGEINDENSSSNYFDSNQRKQKSLNKINTTKSIDVEDDEDDDDYDEYDEETSDKEIDPITNGKNSVTKKNENKVVKFTEADQEVE